MALRPFNTIVVGLLLAQVLYTLPGPWTRARQRQVATAVAPAGTSQQEIRSTELLQHLQSLMTFNQTSRRYETPPLQYSTTAKELFSNHPTAGMEALTDIEVQTRFYASLYRMQHLLPKSLSWQTLQADTARHLQLLHAGLPVLHPLDKPATGLDGLLLSMVGAKRRSTVHLQWQCTAELNITSIAPAGKVECSCGFGGGPANSSSLKNYFQCSQPFVVVADASTEFQASSFALGTSTCTLLGPDLGPFAASVSRAVQRYPLLAYVVEAAAFAVPAAFPARSRCALLEHIHTMSDGFPFFAAMQYVLVLCTAAGEVLAAFLALNIWLAKAQEAHNGRFRLQLGEVVRWGVLFSAFAAVAVTVLAIHDFWQAAVAVLIGKVACYINAWLLPGFDWWLGMHLGLQALVTACGAAQASYSLWKLSSSLCFEQPAQAEQHREAEAPLPQPLQWLLAPAQEPTRHRVRAEGVWPSSPLVIPPEIDDLPVDDIPRGFVCPINRTVMTLPALLLHDGTMAPATYDKEAITEWLASNRSDPKAPDRQLNMDSVKLMYNGELARAIEDWVALKMAELNAKGQHNASKGQNHAGITAAAMRALEAAFSHVANDNDEATGVALVSLKRAARKTR